MKQYRFLAVAAAACCALLLATPAQASLFKVDFGTVGGSDAGWNSLDSLAWFGGFGGINAQPLTDFQGGDADVLIGAGDGVSGDPATYGDFQDSNSGAPGTSATYDGVLVPAAVRNDYFFKSPVDQAGTSARIRFDNINPGMYNVTVFAGRTTDGNGQYAKIWVGDATGSGEPGAQNTGNFGAGSSTQTVTIGAGDYLWYRHLEDGTGGTSGVIIRELPEPSSIALLGLGLGSVFFFVRKRKKQA